MVNMPLPPRPEKNESIKKSIKIHRELQVLGTVSYCLNCSVENKQLQTNPLVLFHFPQPFSKATTYKD
jgi:hypothetical protein